MHAAFIQRLQHVFAISADTHTSSTSTAPLLLLFGHFL